MKRNISSLILVFILLLFWQGAAMGINAAYILPSPTQILVRLWELREPLLYCTGALHFRGAGAFACDFDGLESETGKNALPCYHCIPDDSHNGPCAAVYPLVWLRHLE